ncbi:MAG: hypothetical protein JSS29_01970 [Proteobacteria bacterium]|nr:hypothetical protein [Pseudomonadota bacterium]
MDDLRTWDLPRLEDLEYRLTEEFEPRAQVVFFDRKEGTLIRREFLQRLRELAGVAVNETLEYWLRGLTDGLNGRYPDLNVELPYLELGEEVDPLTLAYCVDNADGSRTELLRVSLKAIVERATGGRTDVSGLRLRRLSIALGALARSVDSPKA